MNLYSADFGEKDPFDMFDKVIPLEDKHQMHRDGCLILWGGEDIGTSLYGETANKMCWRTKPSQRDKRELEYISYAITHDIPIIGICRGAQLVCVAAGGKLAQHIEGHGRSHPVKLLDEDTVIECNSSHHQMMLPPPSAKVLAVAKATQGLDGNNQAVVHDDVNEVVYFPSINALGIQPHPEWTNCPQDFIDYCKRKIKEYLLCSYGQSH